MNTVEKFSMFPDGRMNTDNAARYLGLSPKTMAMKRSKGTGPPYVKRGRIFYFKTDLDSWMGEGRVISTSQASASMSIDLKKVGTAQQALVPPCIGSSTESYASFNGDLS